MSPWSNPKEKSSTAERGASVGGMRKVAAGIYYQFLI
jgi:hypothetical protein